MGFRGVGGLRGLWCSGQLAHPGVHGAGAPVTARLLLGDELLHRDARLVPGGQGWGVLWGAASITRLFQHPRFVLDDFVDGSLGIRRRVRRGCAGIPRQNRQLPLLQELGGPWGWFGDCVGVGCPARHVEPGVPRSGVIRDPRHRRAVCLLPGLTGRGAACREGEEGMVSGGTSTLRGIPG